MNNYDAIIIGSGINSMVAGAILSKKGKKVLILERNSWFGGCIKTEELTLPNFIHEELAGWHPLFVTSPGYAELQADLESHGLEYLNTEVPTGVVLPSGESAVLYSNREKNVELFNRLSPGDGDEYINIMAEFEKDADMIFTILSNDVQSWPVIKSVYKSFRQKGMKDFKLDMGSMLETARDLLDSRFSGKELKALLAPWILHTGLGPDDTAGSVMLQVLAFSLEQASMPVPKGGGVNLVKALSAIIEENDGELLANKHVSKILLENNRVKGVMAAGEEYLATYVLANVTPHQLYQDLLPRDAADDSVLKKADHFKYGNAGMQIHYALSEQLNWENEELKKAALINLTSGIGSVSASVNEAANGLIPKEPTIAVGQHSVLDSSRAPDGKHILWIQLLELPTKLKGDALNELDVKNGYTEGVVEEIVRRVEERVSKHADNFKNSILERRVVSPKDLEHYNPNLVGGNPYAGEAKLDQLLLWRPNGFSKSHETEIKNLYHIGASTHPGPGLSGTSGYLAAKSIK